MAGGSCIMPMDRVTDATAMSITRNGKKQHGADLKAGLQFRKDISRNENLADSDRRRARRGFVADLQKQLNVALARKAKKKGS